MAEEPGDWFLDPDQAVVDNLARVIRSQDDVLLGRGAYDYWAGYWPTSDMEPFATFINGTPKHVFTSSSPEQEWANSTVVAAPAVDYVAELKQPAGGDIGIHGSIGLARSLLRAGLVDELRLVIAPAVAHRGRRLFEAEGELVRLELDTVHHSPSGSLFCDYRVVG